MSDGKIRGAVRTVRTVAVVAVAALLLSACASGSVVVNDGEKIKGEKVVALDAPLEPWVPQIEKRLKQQGFKIKRISRDRTGSLANLGSRYVLRLNGSYYVGWENRCIGGGYRFVSLTAELLDLETNEALASATGEGLSEDCPPLSGSIFGDIASMVADRWE